jgi:hypothetical protein
VDLGAVVILLISLGTRGSATLLQFQGAGYKAALTAAQGLRRFKERPWAVSYKGNCLDHRLTDGFALASALIETFAL